MSYITLNDILGKNSEDLNTLTEGVFTSEKFGDIPFTSLDHKEYKQAKKDCIKMVKNGTGGMTPDVDDDKLMLKVIILAVDKDKRSDFTFASKELLDKLNVVTADEAVSRLLKPGEIYNLAMDIQEASGFGSKKDEEVKDAVKNS